MLKDRRATRAAPTTDRSNTTHDKTRFLALSNRAQGKTDESKD
jgi:hypothetical protein